MNPFKYQLANMEGALTAKVFSILAAFHESMSSERAQNSLEEGILYLYMGGALTAKEISTVAL